MNEAPFVIALAGNPNVGKSTVFNALTGMHQHTGNWTGKTVSNARGSFHAGKVPCELWDLPGTYSLFARSKEEVVARDFLCFGGQDLTILVCDATCLERNLNLVLQVLEVTSHAILCVNLMDEAEHRGVSVDIPLLSKRLGIPVIATSAQKKRSLKPLLSAVETAAQSTETFPTPRKIVYPDPIEEALSTIEIALPAFSSDDPSIPPRRWIALRLLLSDGDSLSPLSKKLGTELAKDPALTELVFAEQERLSLLGLSREHLQDSVVSAILEEAASICDGAVRSDPVRLYARDRKLDHLFTGKLTAILMMLLLLGVVFWLTVVGANLLSDLLASLLVRLEAPLLSFFAFLHAPSWVSGMVVDGGYRVLSTVVSVMLPPMAIFFPLFTLLEDAGYLPRIAYNFDRPFQCCHACGKQALTMCMGFGCNAVGVVGCRIIDSRRERMLAILTNSFVPCNGRFPLLIALLTLFCAGGSSLGAAGLLLLTVAMSVGVTFAVTALLSRTLLRGMPSAFTLELPPYRKPQVGRVLVRSLLDRTVFVLARASALALPMGMLLWLLANGQVGDSSLLRIAADFLDPIGRGIGLDGAILLAFFLGLPANEIVLPIVCMIYTAGGSLAASGTLAETHLLLSANGWSRVTALCMIAFCLFHSPCSTTLLTVYKETNSKKATVFAALLPTAVGILFCILIRTVCG